MQQVSADDGTGAVAISRSLKPPKKLLLISMKTLRTLSSITTLRTVSEQVLTATSDCGTITIGGEVKGNIGDQTYTHNTDPKTTGTFTVDVATTLNYRTNVIALYGRKPMYITEDGTYVLGGWEKVKEWKGAWHTATGDQHTTVSREYVELGCEFDIAWGTDWPYSRPFWTADRTAKQQIDSVEIILSGYVNNADIWIKVNRNVVDGDHNCDSGKQYPEWKDLKVTD